MHEIVSFTKDIEFKTMINKITSISLEHTLMLSGSDSIKGDFIVSGTYKMTAASQLENDFSYKIPVDIVMDDKYDLTNLVIDIDDFTYEVVDEEILRVNIDLLLDKLELKKVEEVKEDEKEKEEDNLVTLDDLFMESDTKEKLELDDLDSHSEKEITDKADAIIKDEKASEENRDSEEKMTLDDVESVENEKEVQSIAVNSVDTENIKKEKTILVKNESDDMKTDGASLFSSFDSSTETYSTYSIYIVRENDSIENIMTKYNTTREQLEEYNDLSDMKIGSKIIIPSSKDE
mgnify:FL=1